MSEVETALREARMKGTPASLQRRAQRTDVLPVPPVKRIAIVTGLKNLLSRMCQLYSSPNGDSLF